MVMRQTLSHSFRCLDRRMPGYSNTVSITAVSGSCERQVENALQVIDVKTIQSVVAMIPHQPRIPGERRKDRFFVVEKPGLDVADLGGYEEAVAEE